MKVSCCSVKAADPVLTLI